PVCARSGSDKAACRRPEDGREVRGGAIMDQLSETLREAGIDASSLAVVFETAAETVYHLEVPGRRAISTWHKLRALVAQTGHYPVLLGDDQALKRLRNRPKHFANKRTPQLLKQARTIHPAARFTQRHH